MKLKSKKTEPYTGKVYDLSVKNKYSYNAEGLAVHNSGAGSLVCYALNITQVDPIKHGLLFERFLSRKKACLDEDSWVLTIDGPKKIKDLSYGEKVKTHTGEYSQIVAIDKTENRTDWYELTYGYVLPKPSLGLYGYKQISYAAGKLLCSHDHKFIIANQFDKTHVQDVPTQIPKYSLVAAKSIKESLEYKVTKTYPRLYGVGSDNKCWSILSVENGTQPKTLIDIRLEKNHTFWVSDKKDGVYVLSHNSLPDIDCLIASTLVETSNGYKEIIKLQIGDKVIGLDGNIETVIAKKIRQSTEKDCLYELYIQLENTIGCIVATSKHKLFTIDNKEIELFYLNKGDIIKSNHGNCFVLEKRVINTQFDLVDITTTGSKSFNIVPFDVIRNDDKLTNTCTYYNNESQQ